MNPDQEYSEFAPLFDKLASTPAGPERDRLRDELVTGHLPLAKHIARRFSGRGQPAEDLEQVATLGLINAVDRFDPERGKGFLPFAIPTIMGEVRRYFRDSGWSVRMPRRLKELHLAINAASAKLYQRLGRAPTPSELAHHLDLSPDEIYEGLEASNAYSAVSVDTPMDDHTGHSLDDTLGDDDPALTNVEDYAALRPLLDRLAPRERLILSLRFYGNLTQSQIADRVGLSQMHVSRLLARTLEALRSGLTAET